MSVTIHTITRYAVQVLTRRMGEEAHSFITVRLYDDDGKIRGTAVFEDFGDREPPKPVGDYKEQTATAHIDLSAYEPYMDILRLEKQVYLKLGWSQKGRVRMLTHVSIDTKKEVIGDYFK